MTAPRALKLSLTHFPDHHRHCHTAIRPHESLRPRTMSCSPSLFPGGLGKNRLLRSQMPRQQQCRPPQHLLLPPRLPRQTRTIPGVVTAREGPGLYPVGRVAICAGDMQASLHRTPGVSLEYQRSQAKLMLKHFREKQAAKIQSSGRCGGVGWVRCEVVGRSRHSRHSRQSWMTGGATFLQLLRIDPLQYFRLEQEE